MNRPAVVAALAWSVEGGLQIQSQVVVLTKY